MLPDGVGRRAPRGDARARRRRVPRAALGGRVPRDAASGSCAGAARERRRGHVRTRGRRRSSSRPSRSTPTGLRAEADDPRRPVVGRVARRAARRDASCLLRVDRIDLSKNPLRGFLAFEQLLERRPELVERGALPGAAVSVAALGRAVPDATSRECLVVVAPRSTSASSSRSSPTSGPIHLLFEDDFHRSLGAMRLYDASSSTRSSTDSTSSARKAPS